MIIPTGFAQVNFKGSGTGYARGWQVAVGVELIGGFPPLTVATTMWNIWDDNIQPVISDQCALESVLCKFGPNSTGVAAEYFATSTGSLTSQSESPQAAVLVKKTTSHGGRKGAGRMFMPGVTEAQTDGAGLLTTAAMTAWQAALNGLLADMLTADMPMTLLHAADPPSPYAVNNLQVQGLFASQRRRLRRVGGRRS